MRTAGIDPRLASAVRRLPSRSLSMRWRAATSADSNASSNVQPPPFHADWYELGRHCRERPLGGQLLHGKCDRPEQDAAKSDPSM